MIFTSFAMDAAIDLSDASKALDLANIRFQLMYFISPYPLPLSTIPTNHPLQPPRRYHNLPPNRTGPIPPQPHNLYTFRPPPPQHLSQFPRLATPLPRNPRFPNPSFPIPRRISLLPRRPQNPNSPTPSLPHYPPS